MENIESNCCSLIWQYFTLKPITEHHDVHDKSKQKIQCNICDSPFNGTSSLTSHLLNIHPEIITELREKIKLTNLSSYFQFDIDYDKTRCTVTNCRINIFHGVDYLKMHLLSCHCINIIISENIQRNTYEMTQQLVVAEDNASANIDQRSGPSSQVIEYQEEFLQYPYNSAWQHFIPETECQIKCIYCGSLYDNRLVFNLEWHLISHSNIKNKLREEIKCSDLSQYFTFDIRPTMTRCIIENCCINIFHGIKRLRDHLRICHNINVYSKVSQNIQRYNSDVMM